MDFCQLQANENNKTQALIAGVGEGKYAIPLSSIVSVENVLAEELSKVDSSDVIYLRGNVIPLINMRKLFEMEPAEYSGETYTIIVCRHKESLFGIVVDQLDEQKEIETKPLGVLEDNTFFQGASVLEDKVALILNLEAYVA